MEFTMLKRIRPVLTVVLAATVAASACTSTSTDSSSTDGSSETTTVATEEAVIPSALEDTYSSFGNTDAETVIVLAQGGPVPIHEIGEAEAIFSGVDLDNVEVVLPHQAQTLWPDRFDDEQISFDQAKAYDSQSTELLARVVQHYVDDNRRVIVVGISFGAFVVQDLLATQGNVADGYLIQVGRLDMPAEVWEPFSEGRFVGFIDGVQIQEADADEAGMGGEGDYTDSNMAKLAAGLGHKRYTELLEDTALNNVVYAYGETDEQVGRLTAEELAFLEAKDVRVIQADGGHGQTIDETLQPGLDLLLHSD